MGERGAFSWLSNFEFWGDVFHECPGDGANDEERDSISGLACAFDGKSELLDCEKDAGND